MGAIFSFIKKTSFYKMYNYDDSYLDSEYDYTDEEYRDHSGYYELPYNDEILYDYSYNTYNGYEQGPDIGSKIND